MLDCLAPCYDTCPLIAFVLLSVLNRVSVGMIFSLEVASLFVYFVLILFETRVLK